MNNLLCAVCKKEMDTLRCYARCPFRPSERPPSVKHPTKDECPDSIREGRAA